MKSTNKSVNPQCILVSQAIRILHVCIEARAGRKFLLSAYIVMYQVITMTIFSENQGGLQDKHYQQSPQTIRGKLYKSNFQLKMDVCVSCVVMSNDLVVP